MMNFDSRYRKWGWEEKVSQSLFPAIPAIYLYIYIKICIIYMQYVVIFVTSVVCFDSTQHMLLIC
jgi:hypothetical protein